jgi:hypothetical protein
MRAIRTRRATNARRRDQPQAGLPASRLPDSVLADREEVRACRSFLARMAAGIRARAASAPTTRMKACEVMVAYREASTAIEPPMSRTLMPTTVPIQLQFTLPGTRYAELAALTHLRFLLRRRRLPPQLDAGGLFGASEPAGKGLLGGSAGHDPRVGDAPWSLRSGRYSHPWSAPATAMRAPSPQRWTSASHRAPDRTHEHYVGVGIVLVVQVIARPRHQQHAQAGEANAR